MVLASESIEWLKGSETFQKIRPFLRIGREVDLAVDWWRRMGDGLRGMSGCLMRVSRGKS